MLRIFALMLFLASICFSQQTDSAKKESLIRGEEIIRKAREAAGLSSSMKAFQIKLHLLSSLKSQGIEALTDIQEEITISSPNKIRLLTIHKEGTLGKSVWNDAVYKRTVETNNNGQRRVQDVTNGLQLSGAAADAVKSKKPNSNASQSVSTRFSNSLWGLVFPLILMHPLESSAEFEYIGRAQAGEKIAHFVQTKSASGHTIQLFFDEKTNHLLMMIEKYTTPDSETETRNYYSNREERNGILVPTKVKLERKTNFKTLPSRTALEYLDLLDFNANPKIDPEIFKIK